MFTTFFYILQIQRSVRTDTKTLYNIFLERSIVCEYHLITKKKSDNNNKKRFLRILRAVNKSEEDSHCQSKYI